MQTSLCCEFRVIQAYYRALNNFQCYTKGSVWRICRDITQGYLAILVGYDVGAYGHDAGYCVRGTIGLGLRFGRKGSGFSRCLPRE